MPFSHSDLLLGPDLTPSAPMVLMGAVATVADISWAMESIVRAGVNPTQNISTIFVPSYVTAVACFCQVHSIVTP